MLTGTINFLFILRNPKDCLLMLTDLIILTKLFSLICTLSSSSVRLEDQADSVVPLSVLRIT